MTVKHTARQWLLLGSSACSKIEVLLVAVFSMWSPLRLYPSHFKFEIAIALLKNYTILPGSDQILAELIQARGKTLQFEIHKLINSIWKKEEFPYL
jgi:hypothetical protein